MNRSELQKRLNDFALRLVPLCEALPKGKLFSIIEGQLLRSGFSASANYRSSCNAQTKKSFISKLSISLEEIDESVFWLEMIRDTNLLPQTKLDPIIKEGIELTKILGASRRTALAKLTIKN
ncbi:MAG: four helix bundle protein [Bacteroidota bacterium]|nr:four helix bundle protein [Bacteroidota bacterium]